MDDDVYARTDYPEDLDWGRPTEENRRVLAAVHARLAAAGVEPGPGGYDAETLIRAVRARGWVHEFWAGGGRYEAVVWRDAPGSEEVASEGWAPEVALARSIDGALTW